MSSIKDEKALLRQQIEANRTVMRLEIALAVHEYHERLGRLKSAARIGSRLSAVVGALRGVIAFFSGGRTPPGSRWRALLRLSALIPLGLAVGRYLKHRRQAQD